MYDEQGFADRGPRRNRDSPPSEVGQWLLVLPPVTIVLVVLGLAVLGGVSSWFVAMTVLAALAAASLVWLRTCIGGGARLTVRPEPAHAERPPPYRRPSAVLAALVMAIDLPFSRARGQWPSDWTSGVLYAAGVFISWSLLSTVFAAIGWLATRGSAAIRSRLGGTPGAIG